MSKSIKMLAIGAAIMIVVSGCTISKSLSKEDAKKKAEDYINTNLLQGGNKAVVKEITDENGLYKMVVEVNEKQKIDSYMTKDGSKFFPQAMDIAKTTEDKNKADEQKNAEKAQANASIPKKDKADVEVFVMSHCPFGTQIEKGIIPAVEALGNKVNFSLKFCDYAMHGEKEVKEQLKQTCIINEQKDKLFTYLKCFLKDENSSDKCTKEAKLDEKKLSACIAKTDKQYNVMKNFNDKASWVSGRFPKFTVFAADNTKYNVKGSPSLIINGTESQSERDPKSLLASICSGFKTPPAECKKELSSETPAAGFGTGTTDSSSSEAGCAN